MHLGCTSSRGLAWPCPQAGRLEKRLMSEIDHRIVDLDVYQIPLRGECDQQVLTEQLRDLRVVAADLNLDPPIGLGI